MCCQYVWEIKVSGVTCQVSGVSAVAGLKSGQFNQKRNFVVSNKGALRRSNLILFVLVVVLVLVLEIRFFSRTTDEDEEEGGSSVFCFMTSVLWSEA